MAVKYWLGTSGDLDAVANWTGAAIPVNNDIIIFPSSVTIGPSTDMAGLTAVDADAVIVEPGVTYDIGGLAAPLDISADKVVHNGRGTLYYKDGAGTTDLLIVASDAPGTAAILTGTAISRILVVRGSVILDGAIGAVASLEVGSVSNYSMDAKVSATAGAGDITLLIQNGGHVTMNNNVTTAILGGGKLVQNSDAITTLYQTGGYCDYRTTSNLTTGIVAGGVLDFTQVIASRTITTLTVFPSAAAEYRKDITTVTNLYEIGGDMASPPRSVSMFPTVGA